MEKENLRDKFIRTVKKRPITMSKLSRTTKISRSWAEKIKKRLFEEDIIEYEKLNGRSYNIKLKDSLLKN